MKLQLNFIKANIIDPSQNEPLFRISDIMSKMENYEEEIFYLKNYRPKQPRSKSI